MKHLRPSSERAAANHGWLQSRHTFSFADFYDPEQMGFSVLRVINEDRIKPSTGFGLHGHQDMEILSYVIDGALEHRDSMGNSAVIRPGEIQRMSAGTGVRHSEKNHSSERSTHFLQIWIVPDKKGYEPSYGQISFEPLLASADFALIASKDGRDGAIRINQRADVYVGRSKDGSSIEQKVAPGRCIWTQVIRGSLRVNGTPLREGDGLGLTDLNCLKLEMGAGTEFLLFDLPESSPGR